MFALSVLQLCTNNTCNPPFQITVTESVICHGGQQILVKILNRLGAAVSMDTSKRLATLVVSKRKKEGASKDLIPNCSNHRQCEYYAGICIRFRVRCFTKLAWNIYPINSTFQGTCHKRTYVYRMNPHIFPGLTVRLRHP